MQNFYSKSKACAIHFSASLIIFSGFIGILLILWYPDPYFTASGGWQGLKIMIIIDLVLGPLLTFIVFNPTKSSKELISDLSLIILLQIVALIWGIYTVYNQRPVATVFWERSFYSVSYSDLKDSYQNTDILNDILNNPRQLYYVERQTIPEENLKLRAEILDFKLPPFQLAHRYRNISPFFYDIKRFSVNIDEVITLNSAMGKDLDALLKKTNTQLLDNSYITLVSRYQNIILVFSASEQLIGTLKAPLKPT